MSVKWSMCEKHVQAQHKRGEPGAVGWQVSSASSGHALTVSLQIAFRRMYNVNFGRCEASEATNFVRYRVQMRPGTLKTLFSMLDWWLDSLCSDCRGDSLFVLQDLPEYLSSSSSSSSSRVQTCTSRVVFVFLFGNPRRTHFLVVSSIVAGR